jgi:hypothetical protein
VLRVLPEKMDQLLHHQRSGCLQSTACGPK